MEHSEIVRLEMTEIIRIWRHNAIGTIPVHMEYSMAIITALMVRSITLTPLLNEGPSPAGTKR